jgi:hypothetical protein
MSHDKLLTDTDIVSGLLRLDDETFDLFYEAWRQFGTNYVAGTIVAVAAVRKLRKAEQEAEE